MDFSENVAVADSNAAAQQTPDPCNSSFLAFASSSNDPDTMTDDNAGPPQNHLVGQADQDQAENPRDSASKGELEMETSSSSSSGDLIKPQTISAKAAPELEQKSKPVNEDHSRIMTANRGLEQLEDVDVGLDRQTHAIWHEDNCPRTSEKNAAAGRVEQIECDGIGPYVQPSVCFGGPIIEKEPNELLPPNPFEASNVVAGEEDNLKKIPNNNSEGRVEHIIDDDGPQLPPGMVVGHDENYEAKLSGNARAGIGGGGNEDRDSDRLVHTDANNIDSLSNQPANQTRPAAPATTQDRLTAQIPPVHPRSTESPTFYAVEATLVKEPSSSSDIVARNPEPTAPIYDAVFIPAQSSLPWWKRRNVRYGGALAVTAGLAATVAVLVNNSRNEGKGDGGLDEGGGTVPESFPPPPFTCAVSNLGTVFDTDCEYCTLAFAMDSEGTAAFFLGHDESLGIYLLSELGDTVNMSSTPYVGKDNWGPEDYIGTIAMSEEVLLAGDSYYGNEYTGVVFVHEKDSSGVWNRTMQITPTNIDGDAQFGQSISTDGDLLVVGAPNDREKDGSAFIYQRTETTWVQVAKLAPEDPENIKEFGHEVIVRGNVVVVADNLYGGEAKGAVFVYLYSSDLSQWGLIDIIINHSCVGKFGDSLDITNGTDLVIGCPLDDGKNGAVYYYKQKDGDGTYSFRQKITPQDGKGFAHIEFGRHLAADGKFMAVGTNEKLNGKVYLFTLDDDDVWKQVAKIPTPSSNHTRFGRSIRLAEDNLLISHKENVYAYKLLCPETAPNENLFLVYP